MSSNNHDHTDPLRDVLLRSGALERREPTVDLAEAARRRLPHAPPRVVARRAARHRLLVQTVTVLALALLLVPATTGAYNLIRGVETPMGTLASATGQANVRAALLAATGQRFDAPLIRSLIAALVWLVQIVVIALIIGFWPRRSAAAGATLLVAPLRAIGTGVLAIGALSIVVGLVLTLLTATVIGLPVAAGVALLAHAPVVLGIAVGVRAMGLRFSGYHPSHDFDRSLIAAAAALALPAALAAFFSLPAALLTIYLLAVPGIGALVLSEGGIRMPVGLGVRG